MQNFNRINKHSDRVQFRELQEIYTFYFHGVFAVTGATWANFPDLEFPAVSRSGIRAKNP